MWYAYKDEIYFRPRGSHNTQNVMNEGHEYISLAIMLIFIHFCDKKKKKVDRK